MIGSRQGVMLKNRVTASGSRRTLAILVLSALVPPLGLITDVTPARAQGTQPKNSAIPLASILSSMEKAESDVQLPRQVTREYHLGTAASITSDSEVVAHVDFTPPARFVIERHFGSMRAEYVVRNVLQHEMEMATSSQKIQAAAITRANYDFQLAGDDSIDGRTCYVLVLNPKRQESELIRGRIWVDRDSFLIRRIAGDLAKSPSWWVKNVRVDARFAEFQGMWLQTNVVASADVRCFGSQQLTSRVVDFSQMPLTAAKTRRRQYQPLPAAAIH